MFLLSFYHIWRVALRFMLRWPLLLMFLQRVSILLSTLVSAKTAGININIIFEAIFFLLALLIILYTHTGNILVT